MRRYRRRTSSQYLLPFVLLVSLGVLLILAFQLWGMFFSSAKGDALYYLAEGRSKVLAFGTTEWENLYNGSKVKLGDSVKTLNGAKGVITFYDGTVLRLDEDTQITLLDITKKSDYQEILIYLNSGHIWVNKPKENVIRKTDFVISTSYASYSITGTIFALAKSEEEILRVIRGQVQVDILEEADGKSRSIESIPVGIGQQINLSDRVMQDYYERKSPSVLSVLDPLFQQSDWYIWNAKEDENPTDFTKWTGGTITDQEASPENGLSPLVLNGVTIDDNAPKSDLAAPTLVSPKSATIVTAKDTQTLSGKAVEGVKKILLKQTLSGDSSPSKVLIASYDEEKLTWSYDISFVKSNIRSGKNVYEFVGIDEWAKETEALRVEIELEALEPDLVNDKPDSDTAKVALSTPKVVSVGDKPYQSGMKVTTDGFAIVGSVGGADAVWVDDFKLSRYAAGDATWTYNVRTSYGNLQAGLNSYKVYGVSEDGKKSADLTIQINYEPPVTASTTVPSASAATGTSGTTASATSTPTTTATSSTPAAAATTVSSAVPVVVPERPINSSNQ